MSDVELVAIVNSFNRLALMEKALPALEQALANLGLGTAIFVFDAGSTDGSLEWLGKKEAAAGPVRLHVIRAGPGADCSFSAGVNAACQGAAEHYPATRWFLLYETDNWLAGAEPLLLAIKLIGSDPGLAAVGFTVSKHSGAPAGFGTRLPGLITFVLGQQLTFWLKLDSPRLTAGGQIDGCDWVYCDVVFTSPLVLRRSAFEGTGGMDARMFPFSDCDTDLCWRLKQAGWRLAVLKTSGVVHDNLGEMSVWSAARVLDYHRARYRLLRRHLGAHVSLLKPLLLLRHLAEIVLLQLLPRAAPAKRLALEKRWLLARSVLSGYEQEQRAGAVRQSA